MESVANRCVVVTGARGFIGSHLCTFLRNRGIEVCEWDLPHVDLSDASSVAAAMERDRPHTIHHLAAVGATAEHAHDPSLVGTNVQMMANLLRVTPRGAVMVVTGSMSEYGTAGVLSETSVCMPTTAYGVAKLATTTYAMAYAPRAGVDVRVARLFGVYGPGESANRLFPTLVDNLRDGKVVPLSDGEQFRDFVHVRDVCDGLARLADANVGSVVVNLGTGTAVSIKDVACWVAESIGVDKALLGFGQRPRSPGDQPRIEANISRLRDILKWSPPQRLLSEKDVLGLLQGKKLS